MESVLVTGGAGFIGSHTAEFYADRGISVTIFDDLSRAETLNSDDSRNTAAFNWRYLDRNYEEIRLIEGDVRDQEHIQNVVEGHDAVVHTAGQVAVTASLKDPRSDFKINAEGTFNVLEAARKSETDPAVVFASTNKVYGDNVNRIPVEEKKNRYEFQDPEYQSGVPETVSIDGCEHTPYGVSKLAADLYVQDYAHRNEVDAAVFRMSCIYGPRQFGTEDQGWIAHFILNTLQNEPLTIYGDGKQVRDVLYVTDLVRAYHSFLSDPTGKPAVYNIGGGPDQTTSLVELLELLERLTGNRSDVTFEDWREGDQKVYITDIGRARSVLDWKPKVDLEDGIQRYLNWYQNTETGFLHK